MWEAVFLQLLSRLFLEIDGDQGEQMKGGEGSVSISSGPALWRSN